MNLFILYTGFVSKEITKVTSFILIGLYVGYVAVVAIMSTSKFQPRMSIKPENLAKI